MRNGEEGHVEVGKRVLIVLGEDEVARTRERGVHLGERAPGERIGGDRAQLEARVAQQKASKFRTREASGPNDTGFNLHNVDSLSNWFYHLRLCERRIARPKHKATTAHVLA